MIIDALALGSSGQIGPGPTTGLWCPQPFTLGSSGHIVIDLPPVDDGGRPGGGQSKGYDPGYHPNRAIAMREDEEIAGVIQALLPKKR